MRISIEELQSSEDFVLIETLDHNEILPFVFEQLGRKNLITIGFKFGLLLTLVGSIVYMAITIFQGEVKILSSISWYVLGIILGTTVVIPFHELLHGIAYKLEGAPKVSYHSNLSQMMFYAAADKFVIGGRAFKRVAMAPFIVISIACVVSFFMTSINLQIGILGFFISHTIACAGDFSFLSFIHQHRGKKLYTYDDLADKKSFVFLSVEN